MGIEDPATTRSFMLARTHLTCDDDLVVGQAQEAFPVKGGGLIRAIPSLTDSWWLRGADRVCSILTEELRCLAYPTTNG